MKPFEFVPGFYFTFFNHNLFLFKIFKEFLMDQIGNHRMKQHFGFID